MKTSIFALAAVAGCVVVPAVAQAQDADTTVVAEQQGAQPMAPAVTPTAVTAAVEGEAKRCELHVWPTENYLGVKMGLFSGFGVVGALADQAGHAKGVQTVKDLMRDYLGPDIQMAELDKLSYVEKLGLNPAEYEIVVHEPTPFNEDVKKDKALKAEVRAFNDKLNNGTRVSDSTNGCYAELVTTHIFYHKAMMYGSNLFTGWVYREFDGDKVVTQGKGQVKNPLEEFPPKEESKIETAKVELLDAYAKDFDEWVVKKSGI